MNYIHIKGVLILGYVAVISKPHLWQQCAMHEFCMNIFYDKIGVV